MQVYAEMNQFQGRIQKFLGKSGSKLRWYENKNSEEECYLPLPSINHIRCVSKLTGNIFRQ